MTSRRPHRIRASMGLCSILAIALSWHPASADHGAAFADRQWIAQAGDGAGNTAPVIEGFAVQSVLFDAARFRFSQTAQNAPRPASTRYIAFGTVPVDPQVAQVTSQLAVSQSDDGINWSTPERAVLRDSTSGDVAFRLDEPNGYFDVTFLGSQTGPPISGSGQFRIHYKSYRGEATSIASLRTAVSDDGRVWTFDRAIGEEQTARVLSQTPGTFNARSDGPTEVIRQARGSLPGDSFASPPGDQLTCATADPDGSGPAGVSPMNCRWLMLYNSSDGDKQYISLASSPDGLFWRGHATALLSPGASGAWDDRSVAIGKLRIRQPSTDPLVKLYDLFYAGGRAPAAGETCAGAAGACWSLGTATSSNGLTFAKTAANPVTPRGLFEVFTNGSPVSLLHPTVVEDAAHNGGGHARIFLTRLTEASGSTWERDTFLAYTSPAPGAAPQIRFSSPVGPYQATDDAAVEFWVTDTIGAPPLVDFRTLSVRLDGVAMQGMVLDTPQIVTALSRTSTRVRMPRLTNLPDGPHVLEVRVADAEGNVGTASTSFVVDTEAPDTKITSTPAPPVIGFPLGSPRFTGTTEEAVLGTAIDEIFASVTNPLGEVKQYAIPDRLIVKDSARSWSWTFIASSSDTHFAVPGNYTFRFGGKDLAKNIEASDGENTIVLTVV